MSGFNKHILRIVLFFLFVSSCYALDQEVTVEMGKGIRSNYAFMEARRFEVTGDLKQAYTLYRDSYMLDSLNYRSAYRAGRILSDMGHFENAKAAYLRSIAIADDFYPAYNSLGILLNRLGERLDAIKTLSDGVLAAPDYAPAWRNLGRTLVEGGYEAEALKVYERAVKLDENHFDSRVTYGILLAKLGNIERAKEQVRRVLRSDPQNKRAKETSEWLISWPGKEIKKDKIPETLKIPAKIKIPPVTEEKNKSLPRRYENSWSFDPPDPSMVDVDILKQNARDYLRLGRYKEAEEVLEITVQYEDKDKRLWADYGFALYKLKKYDRAAEAYNRAILAGEKEKQPVTWYYMNRGLSLYYAGDYKTSTKALKKAVEMNDELSRAHYYLGLVRIEREQYRYAVRSLKKAVKLSPDHVESQLALGVAYIKAGAGERAIVHYRKALSLRPDDPEILMDLARLLERERFLQEAGDVYIEFAKVTEDMESYRLWRDIAIKRIERYKRGDDFTQVTTP